MKKQIGIYKIQSIVKPERFYIGSSNNIGGRWKSHLSDFRLNRHHSHKLQRHCNKYGISDLIFMVLLNCNKDTLVKNEQYFLDTYKPYFNECKVAGNCSGLKASKETRRKMSEHSMGMKHSEETKIKIGNKTRGHIVSLEARKIMSECKKGKPTWNKGKTDIYSNEALDKMRKARIGKRPWNKGLRYKINKKIA